MPFMYSEQWCGCGSLSGGQDEDNYPRPGLFGLNCVACTGTLSVLCGRCYFRSCISANNEEMPCDQSLFVLPALSHTNESLAFSPRPDCRIPQYFREYCPSVCHVSDRHATRGCPHDPGAILGSAYFAGR